MKVRVSNDGLQGDEEKQCIDCKRLLPQYARPLGIWETSNLLIEHGDGFPLLFQFLKFIIILFIWMFIFQGIFFIVILLLENGGKDPSLVNLFSVSVIVERNQNGSYKTNPTLIRVYVVLTLLTNLFVIVLICIFWIKQFRLKVELDLK